MIYCADTEIRGLPGIGEKRAAMFGKLGIVNVGGLLRHFPRGYQNRGDITPLADTCDGEIVSLMLTVGTKAVNAVTRTRMTYTKFTAFDDSGRCTITFFNNKFAAQNFQVGGEFRFFGKVKVNNGKRELSSPSFEPVKPYEALPDIISIYPLTAGLSQKVVSSLIGNLLNRMNNDDMPRIIPEDVRVRAGLCDAEEAYRTIHRPASLGELERARKYFIFEELYEFGLNIAKAKQGARVGQAPLLSVSDSRFSEFTASLPYVLTNAQLRSINEIRADLASGMPMRRLLSGDVGSGKTVCAAAAAYIAISCGSQTAMMAPTEILARQHYNDLSPLFGKFGLKVGLLIGSMSQSEKKAAHKALSDGEISFVIGTHALLSESVKFHGCALVITDEQHRFGVGQRDTLSQKGEETLEGDVHAHTLVMSATPIPRSLALVLYGDLDQSVLDELPPGRQKVDTFVVDSSYNERLDNFIIKQTSAGGRAYIVCPSVEGSDEDTDGGDVVQFDYGYDAEEIANANLPMSNAVDEAQRLRDAFPNLKVGCVHGRMKSSDKDAAMSSFADGETNVLVSTTVIEVGVNVPQATLMIVRNAERFGLSQLHQLRGRVGRGSAKSYCILVSDSKNETSRSRLEAMRSTNNGYEIAQRDLEIRGPGDFLPNNEGDARQSGEFRFRFAGFNADMDLLKAAFAEAERTVYKGKE